MSQDQIVAFLSKTNKTLSKKYGANILYAADELENFKPFETGFAGIDHVVSGIGGLPRGGLTIIHGAESCGKTSLCLEMAENHIRMHPEAKILYIDVENALDGSFMDYKKMSKSNFIISPLNACEDLLTITKDALSENLFDAIFIDSFAKIDSEKVIDADVGEAVQRNRRAALLTEFLRKISFILRQSKTALVGINQHIQNQDPSPWAKKTILPGGNQQLYSANLILALRRSKNLKLPSGERLGFETTIVAEKNKISPNERMTTILRYFYNKGFDKAASLLAYLLDIGVCKELGMKRFEFVDKATFYPEVFRFNKFESDIISWCADNKQIDLYSLKGDLTNAKKEEDGDTPVETEE